MARELTVTDPREIAAVAEIVGCDTDEPSAIVALDGDAALDEDGRLVVRGRLAELFEECLPLVDVPGHPFHTADEWNAIAEADDAMDDEE